MGTRSQFIYCLIKPVYVSFMAHIRYPLLTSRNFYVLFKKNVRLFAHERQVATAPYEHRAGVAQCVRQLDYLTTHTSLSPLRRGFESGFVNYKKGALELQPHVIKFKVRLTSMHLQKKILKNPVFKINNFFSRCLFNI